MIIKKSFLSNFSFFLVPGLRQEFLSWRIVYQSGYVVIWIGFTFSGTAVQDRYRYRGLNPLDWGPRLLAPGPLSTAFLDKMCDQQQQQHQKLYLHDHKGITVLQKLLV